MNWFKSLITAICTAGICFGALYIICPIGKMAKSVKYVFSLCFLLIIITVVGVNVKFNTYEFGFENSIKFDNSQTEVATAKSVYELALKNAGIEFSQIEVFTDISEEGDISINKVIVYSACEKEKIVAALTPAAENFEVEVINE